MKAVGYFRESPVRDITLAQQNKAFLQFCQREGYEVAGTFADGGSSNGHAPGFRQLVAFLRESGDSPPTGIIVVVPSVESLGSDLRDAARRMFQIEGLGAHIAQMSGAADATADLMTLWTSQEDGGRLSERVRAAMRRKAVKGEVLGRPPTATRSATAAASSLSPRKPLSSATSSASTSRRAWASASSPAASTKRASAPAAAATGAWSASATSSATASTSAPTPASACASPAATPARLQRRLQGRPGSPQCPPHQLRPPRHVAVPPLRHRPLRLLREQAHRRQPQTGMEAPERRAGLQLLPLLPVRVTHQPERLQLPHPARRRPRAPRPPGPHRALRRRRHLPPRWR